MKKLFRSAKSSMLNLGLKAISQNEKLCYMFYNTSLKNIKPIVIVVVIESMYKEFIHLLKKNGPIKSHGKFTNGLINQIPVSLIRQEMGAPNSAILMEILYRAQVKMIFRCEVCGSLIAEQPIGSVVIPTSCLMGDGTCPYYLRKYHDDIFKCKNFSKISNITHQIHIEPELVEEIRVFISQMREKSDFGIYLTKIWTTDALFCESNEEIRQWKEFGAQTVDMETSIMYLLGEIFHIPTLAILGVVDSPGSEEFDLINSNRIHPETQLAGKRVIKFMDHNINDLIDIIQTMFHAN